MQRQFQMFSVCLGNVLAKKLPKTQQKLRQLWPRSICFLQLRLLVLPILFCLLITNEQVQVKWNKLNGRHHCSHWSPWFNLFICPSALQVRAGQQSITANFGLWLPIFIMLWSLWLVAFPRNLFLLFSEADVP